MSCTAGRATSELQWRRGLRHPLRHRFLHRLRHPAAGTEKSTQFIATPPSPALDAHPKSLSHHKAWGTPAA
eukprot:6665320-Pyramimonas_sp.AAC.1